jgi:ferric-dicitrate binding protein FerR (iron transport regulator)
MNEPRDEAHALRAMVEEVRAEQPRELAWDTIEARLLAAIDREAEVPKPEARALAAPGSSGRLRRGIAIAATAAVLAIGSGAALTRGLNSGPPSAPIEVATHEAGATEAGTARGDATTARVSRRAVSPDSVPLAPGEAGAHGAHDLLALAPGDVIEAGPAKVVVGHDGLVVWTLAPGGRVLLRSLGDHGIGHTVMLERGAIRAEVTPRDPSAGIVESFAVEVETTRVAVHGTAFSVTRGEEDGRVLVDVEHGSVAVGPTGQPGVTQGTLLVGPRRASFALDHAGDARFLPRPDGGATPLGATLHSAGVALADPGARLAASARSIAPQGAPEGQVVPLPRSPVERSATQPSSAPSHPAPTLTVEGVSTQLATCFEQTYGKSSGAVDVSVTSTLQLVLTTEGAVKESRFDPPLKPAFQDCAAGVLAGRFTDRSGPVAIPLLFKR